jgi:hypothetical protein
MPSPRGNGKIKGEKKGQCRQLIAAYKKQGGRDDYYRENYVLCKVGNMWE